MSKKKKNLSPDHKVFWSKESQEWYQEVVEQCYSLLGNYSIDPEYDYAIVRPYVQSVIPAIKYGIINDQCDLHEGEQFLRTDFDWTFRYYDPNVPTIPLLYIFLLIRFEFLPSNNRMQNLEYVFNSIIGKDKHGNDVRIKSTPRHNLNVAASMLNLLIREQDDCFNNEKILRLISFENLTLDDNCWSGIITSEDY